MINDQNRGKVLLVVIGILLITNIGMLVFFLPGEHNSKSSPSRMDRKAYISNMLKNDIGFTPEQLVKYDTLSKRHREKMNLIFDTARTKKNEQFKELVAGDFSDSVIYRLAAASAASQERMEISMFNHIRNIRRLCNTEQLAKFDTSFGKVFNRRGGDSRRKSNK